MEFGGLLGELTNRTTCGTALFTFMAWSFSEKINMTGKLTEWKLAARA